ncbi:MAG: hypothetical protein HY815_29630 [Candidatus Riflebacteria bacterium]|nr:hypothetical protein [Candidatus Riflebacteria bacterium]
MDRATLITLLVVIAAIVSYADELAVALRSLLDAAGSPRRRRPEPPVGLLELAATDLVSADPVRIDRGTAILTFQPGEEAVAQLIKLLAHPDQEVGRRAATILHRRQDPQGLEPLYRWLAQRPAA